MIIGNGNIAKTLIDNDKLLFFTSGVSDSNCKDEKKYKREIDLLKQVNTEKHIVYFSNLKIYYANDRYTKHKIEIDVYIMETYTNFSSNTHGFSPNFH